MGRSWPWFTNLFETIGETLSRIFKGVINSSIDTLNAFLAFITSGPNNLIKAVNYVGGKIAPGYTPIAELPSIPKILRLATGAVIPAGAEFAVILGDQKSGRNLDAPESLIRQIVREETAGVAQLTDTHIYFDGTMGELIRMMNPHIVRENKRVGGSMIISGRVGA